MKAQNPLINFLYLRIQINKTDGQEKIWKGFVVNGSSMNWKVCKIIFFVEKYTNIWRTLRAIRPQWSSYVL